MNNMPYFKDPVIEHVFSLPETPYHTMPEHNTACDPADIGSVYIAMSSATADSDGPTKILLGLHGSGRNAGSYFEIPFYRYQRDRALRSGFIFAAVSNGLSEWGLDDGLDRVLALLTMLKRHFGDLDVVVPWASSAGGAMMFRMIATLSSHSELSPIRRAVGTFPLYDITSVFGISSGCANAWQADTPEELVDHLGDRNPPSFVRKLAGCEYWIGHGVDDVVVNLEKNVGRLQREVVNLGGRVTIHRSTGGHSTENFEVYDDERIGTFIDV